MKKRILLGGTMAAALVASAMLTSCAPKDVFHIYAWNDEFKGFFDKYVSDEKEAGLKTYHLDGKEVKWTIVPNEGTKYQDALDNALENNANANTEKKVDMFLAEADYIKKYANTAVTQDVKALGVTNFSNTYQYTVEAASDAAGVVKGVSFQCCPSGLIYNRTIAEDVLGSDDPAVVGAALDTWEEFDAVAAQAKAKGYYMTACDGDSYRVFSNNAQSAWVDANGTITIPEVVYDWMDQAESYVQNGYTIAADVWSAEKVANITAGQTNALCVFGPSWYYNFSMDKSEAGDWGLVAGPQAHFWGGTWLLAPTGADDTDLVAKVMNAFINDEEVCENLIKNEGQFTNNKAVNEAVANSADYAGNTFLGGQNDTLIFIDLADDIKFQNTTVYDQFCNEQIQSCFREYLNGSVSKEQAIANFYASVKEKYTNLNIPA